MTTIVYLHGFASTGDSDKSRSLRMEFMNTTVLAPDLNVVPIRQVWKLLQEINGELIFVGTSLGGFWANYFAQATNSRAILVNPSVTPSTTLKGVETTNYKTGKAVIVTDDDIEALADAERAIALTYNGSLIDLFLAADDDVLPYLPTLTALKGYNSAHITHDGGHRYNDNWDLVLNKLATLL